MCLCILSACGKEETTTVEEITPQDIYAEMQIALASQRYIGLYCGVLDQNLSITSTSQIYTDTNSQIYLTTYESSEQEPITIWSNRYSAYLDTKYGWVETDSVASQYEGIISNFFTFVVHDSLKYGDVVGEDATAELSNCYILEQIAKNEDEIILYAMIGIDKTTYLPKYVSLQYYSPDTLAVMLADDTSINDDENLLSSKIYKFEFYDTQSNEFIKFQNLIAKPGDVITETEYTKRYWEDNHEESD